MTEAKGGAMKKRIRVFCWLIVSLLVPRFSLSAEPSLLASKYLERTNLREKYACAIFCESTSNNRDDPNRSSYVETWFLHSYDPEQDSHRQDEINQLMLNGRGDIVSTALRVTLFYHRKNRKVVQWNGTSQRKLALIDKEEEEQFKSLRDQAYFEPLGVPILGHSCLNRRSGPQLNSSVRTLFSTYQKIEEEELPYGVAQVFSTRFPELKVKVLFDERVGDMPVLKQLVLNGKHYESIATKWTQIKNRWYPASVEVERDYANIADTRKLKYYWMFDDFPPDLFPVGDAKKTNAVELRELIVKKSGVPIR
jgi:hypothetical protein